MDLTALLAMVENAATLTDEELAQLEEDLSAAVEALTEDPDDDALVEAEAAVAAIEAVRAEAGARIEAATARTERAQALRDRIRAEADDAARGDEGEPAEVVEVVEVVEEEPVAVAASSRRPATPAPVPARQPGRIGRVAARRSPEASLAQPPAAQGPPAMTFPEWGLTAAANAPGIPAGAPVADYETLGRVFEQAWRAMSGPSSGPRVSVPLVRAGKGAVGEYGQERTLSRDSRANASKIRDVVHPAALTASGGMCAPININYDLPVMGSDARPVRDDMLVRFGADRGGIRTLVPPVLADVAGAIGFWTNANDITAASNDGTGDLLKPCITIDCPDEVESLVYAVTRCFKVGNFRQRFFPEQIEAVMRLIAIAHARQADTKLLQAIGASSTAVTVGRQLGTVRDVLANLDVAQAAYRDRWRLGGLERLRFGAPRWLLDNMRTDLARSLPGSTDEQLAAADAKISSFLTARNINLTWLMDGENAGQHFAAQTAGPLVQYPTMALTYLYPEGAHLFLDGGTLDLGLVRDSSLNATNDVMFFAETFEGHHYQGPESMRIAMTICPDGSVAGTVDIDPCGNDPV